MESTVLILLAAGPIGAIDVVWFHLVKFKLYSRPQSIREEVTHIARGVFFPLGLGVLLYGRPEGWWFWLIVAVFAIELVNSLVDITLEPASREPDRVPGPELVVHYVGATLMGAAGASYLLFEWGAGSRPTNLAPHELDAISPWIVPMGYFMVIVAVALVATEATLFARCRLRAERRSPG